MTLLTSLGENLYFLRNVNLELCPIRLLVREDTVLLIDLLYSRTSKFVCGTINPTVSFGKDSLLLRLLYPPLKFEVHPFVMEITTTLHIK